MPRLPGPALAVCGPRGAGKTALLEAVIPELTGRGLAVAALKHHGHPGGLSVDQPGKDSDRLYRAGADVRLEAPDEAFARVHRGGDADLVDVLSALLADHDLVLVEGHKTAPLPKVWLSGEGATGPPDGLEHVLAVLLPGPDRVARMLEVLDAWLPKAWATVPVMAGVLVGGAGSRLGRPKQLIPYRGATFLEAVVAALAAAIPDVVLLGAGDVPASCAHLARIADVPAAAGPLAGMLAACRWAPHAAWVFAACDLPLLKPEAVAWLLARRAPGRWAGLPECGTGVEPLFALYEPQARARLEGLAAAGAGPSSLRDHPRAGVLAPPPELRPCWCNVNTLADLATLDTRS
jgi:molybdopterin-guanine dinucleotide biosynthesis protein MobB